VLCLKPNPADRGVVLRIEDALNQTGELLNQIKSGESRKEFISEILTYWDNKKTSSLIIKSLIDFEENTKEVVYLWGNDELVFGENEKQIIDWEKNKGNKISRKVLQRGYCVWIEEPPIPEEYPDNLKGCISIIGEQAVKDFLSLEKRYPFIISVKTDTGHVFLGVILNPIKQSEFLKGGFRNTNKIPEKLLLNRLSQSKIFRAVVERVDSSWIHGRDKDSEHIKIKEKKVALIGSGSIGSLLLLQLVKTGIGNFILVDIDKLKSGNISRHLLGVESIGESKANGLSAALKKQHPHINYITAMNSKVENLSKKELEQISDCDLVISAGLNWEGDYFLSNWRNTLDRKMPMIYIWSEAFALVGQAVSIIGDDSLLCHFESDGKPRFRATEWENEMALVEEAGCGNSFQPHGVVDLGFIVNLGAKLVMDVLCGKTIVSERRTWFTTNEAVTSLGGKLTGYFDGENQIKISLLSR
jgi:molybdopterin/thiamine biosynthesis adenylyltransferase